MTKDLELQIANCFITLNQTMIRFIFKNHILLISKPIWIFVALDALSVELQILFEVQGQ
jgi:hypothetical protein